MAPSKNLTGREIFELVRTDLRKVEEEFCRQSVSSVPAITQIGQYLQISGGKRLRPALLLLGAKFCGYEGPSAVRLGTVVELIHTATLIHDDIIDEADTRRGRPSTNSRWGNHLSVLAGDWLYMQAFNIAVTERNFRVLDLLIRLTQVMVEGELLQLARLRRIDVSEEEYIELADRKTASLFSVCMRLGAVLGGKNEEEEAQLSAYGTHLGLAFQLIDDLLDFTSSEEKLGKPIGNDLREGKVTLPLIYMLRKCEPDELQKVATVLDERGFRSVRFEEIRALIERNGTVAATHSRARQFAAIAKGCLDSFPESPYKEALCSLADFIVERES